jgi:hypothetical protein
VPLTPEQKEAVVELIKQAGEVDYSYKFQRRKELWTQASHVWAQSGKVADTLPEGNLKKLVLATGRAYHDVAVMWCGYTNQFGYFTREDVMRVIEWLDMQNMSPSEMVVTTFGAASKLKDALSAALARSPTAQSPTVPSVDRRASPTEASGGETNLTLDQLERRAHQLSGELDKLATGSDEKSDGTSLTTGGDWSFPKQGMRSHYNETIKGMVYDLGDGIYAGHTKLGDDPVVTIIFSVPVLKDEMNDADLALFTASKAVNLPRLLADTVLKQENSFEHRFRTAGGKIVLVTLARDRETAIVRVK